VNQEMKVYSFIQKKKKKNEKKGFALPNKLFGFQPWIFSASKQSINEQTQNQPHKEKCENK
jgi:hypothetical protein